MRRSMPNDLDFLNSPRFSFVIGVVGNGISVVDTSQTWCFLSTMRFGGTIPAATALAPKLRLSSGNVELRALLVGVSASGFEQ